jgi:FkbM family methyltransferase
MMIAAADKARGLRALLSKHLGWRYRNFQVNNRAVGRAVELLGNRVRLDGMRFSLDCPLITTPLKSTIAFGLHEWEERELVKRHLPRDLPVIELGGGLGVVSCLINSRLSNPNRHVVVEANPAMIDVLNRNRQLNACAFQVINKALGYRRESIDLAIDAEFVGTRTVNIGAASVVSVPSVTLAALLDRFNFERAGVICDIEGAEAGLIESELPVLRERAPYLMMEMHPRILSASVVDRLIDKLRVAGFSILDTLGDCVFARFTGARADARGQRYDGSAADAVPGAGTGPAFTP